MGRSLILQIAIQILLLIPIIYSEPYCGVPCPLHAECISENHCECNIGYEQFISDYDGRPNCRALCEQPCGKNSICAEPNHCACIQGYTTVLDQCLPTCKSGCPNGECVAPEMCDCEEGYESVDDTCKELNDGSADSAADDEDEKFVCKNGRMLYNGRCIQTTTTTSTTVSNIRNEETDETTEKSHFRNGLYRVEETEETTEKSEDTTVKNLFDLDGMVDDNGELNGEYIYSTESPRLMCPAGYIYHEGQCRPEIEVKNACSLELCGPNTKCVDYEKCDCLPGFFWHYVDGGRSLRCVSTEQAQQEHWQIVQPDNYKHGTHWLNTFYTSLGVCCALSALLVLLFTLFKKSK